MMVSFLSGFKQSQFFEFLGIILPFLPSIVKYKSQKPTIMKTQLITRGSIIVAVIVIFVAMLATSCSSLTATADYDKNLDFTQFKTASFYGWAKESDSILNRFDKERIENATTNEFQKRGYEFVGAKSDIVVSLFVVVDKKTSRTAYTNHYGMGGYYGYYGYGWGPRYGGSTTTIQDVEYAEGTIIIDVFDGKTKELIWQGVASDVISENPQTRDRQVPYIIRRLMSNYPVKVNG